MCHNIAINEDTGFAYLLGSNQASGGLHILDLNNDPAVPVFEAEFSEDGYVHDAQIVIYEGPDTEHRGKEIAVCCNEDTLTIVDVTYKQNMQMLSREGYPESSYVHQGWFDEDQRFFFPRR